VNHLKPPIKLRGHHLICLHFFIGEGYNVEFVAHLSEIVKRAEAGDKIEVCSGADDVCKRCPYLKDDKCMYDKNADPEIQEMDRRAIELLRLKMAERVNWIDIKKRIPGILYEWSRNYCNDCDWRKACEKKVRVNKFKVNFDEIQKAMEDTVRDSFDYFLDLETGEVIALSEEVLSEVQSSLYEGDYDELEDGIESIEFDKEPDLPYWMEDELELAMEVLLDEDGQYLRIPERKSAEAHKVMTEFIETVTDPVLKEELATALNGKGAFRRFKDVLLDYPKERKRWHGYNAKAMKKVITEWLESIEVRSEKEW